MTRTISPLCQGKFLLTKENRARPPCDITRVTHVKAEELPKAPELNPQVCSDEKTTEGGAHPGFVGEICAWATRTFHPSFHLPPPTQPFQPSTRTRRSPFRFTAPLRGLINASELYRPSRKLIRLDYFISPLFHTLGN